MITFILFYFRGPHRIPLSSEVSLLNKDCYYFYYYYYYYYYYYCYYYYAFMISNYWSKLHG